MNITENSLYGHLHKEKYLPPVGILFSEAWCFSAHFDWNGWPAGLSYNLATLPAPPSAHNYMITD